MFHNPVLLNESAQLLNIKEGSVVLDCTLGGGGHTELFLKKVGPKGTVIAIDKDEDAINNAQNVLIEKKEYKNLILINDNYSNIFDILSNLGIDSVDSIFADLGVSSYQIDNFHRGFSFQSPNAKLDMRMYSGDMVTASQIINSYSKRELEKIFKTYGNEKYSKQIASEIKYYRDKKKILYVKDLLEVLDIAMPDKVRKKDKGYPKKVFQALRIEVNNELEHLKKFLTLVPFVLNDKGRLGIITFHGIEERLTREIMKIFEKQRGYERLEGIEDLKKNYKMYQFVSVIPSNIEINKNPRSRSAKLKVWEKHSV